MASTQFESTRVHPRRRPVVNTSSNLAKTDEEPTASKLQLKKGETFNAPTSPPSAESDPVMNIRSLPHRSPTSLDALAASEESMSSIFERLNLDENSEGQGASTDNQSAGASTLNSAADKDEHNPFPSVKKVSTQQEDHDHDSDSGLGSSVSDCDSMSEISEQDNHDASVEQDSTITSPIAASQGTNPRHQLPLSACKQIERYLLVPLLKEPKLEDFHPLVRSVPTRIANKQIVCLRDLEKILLWLAPKFSKSRSSYLSFCEYTIQCLHTSVSHLNAKDQRLPADRPYTNGYFLDLVTQVRRYAAMVQASKAEALQSNKDKPSVPPASLQGGLSVNGCAAELVIMTDGQVISLATGKPFEGAVSIKRAHETVDEVTDEGVVRSMARRKKNAPPMDINQKCAHCDKVFKRPCDLTKHEKTHSRPWKCPDTTCKYNLVGWPTEKERDRHVNDKHSENPIIFKCEFGGCTYTSKRESNCKQHMEKAHGWKYNRQKSNSRARGSKSKRGTSLRAASHQDSPSTPDAMTPASGQTDFNTPSLGPTPSPCEPSLIYSDGSSFINFADPPAPVPGNGYSAFYNASVVNQPEAAMSYQASPEGTAPSYQTPRTYQTSPDATMAHDFQFTAEDIANLGSLGSLEAQFAMGNPNELVSHLNMHQSIVASMSSVPSASSVPDLSGSVSASQGNSPCAPAASGGNLCDNIDWTRVEYSLQNNINDLHGGNDNGNDQAMMMSGLSPTAQGHLMLFSPDNGLAAANIGASFPYGGQDMQQNLQDFSGQELQDFTLFETPMPTYPAANLTDPAFNWVGGPWPGMDKAIAFD
ncbi:Cys2-His2 zinc finger transcription factor AceA [Penicillium oxalicum 114-2]|uniref:Cys2-His2 zinc finger transcription factor AceA n=1 Tax=Penicillium oxalicum (strain 114-2 / CGMCC 5302) TaxID=933388 RepID=S8AYJ0_PENO1|nr:Cys2-His2 zinc finger transcription factor AceA [Penicillium oxalicum 114-2]